MLPMFYKYRLTPIETTKIKRDSTMYISAVCFNNGKQKNTARYSSSSDI